MVSLSWLKDGLVFTSAKFFKHLGAYSRVPEFIVLLREYIDPKVFDQKLCTDFFNILPDFR